MSVRYGSLSEDEREARRTVKQACNVAYSPTVATAEIAESMDISAEEAYELLLSVSEEGYIKTKPVAGTDPDDPRNHVWW